MAYRKRGGNMLKRAFALSDKGAKDLKKGIAAATLYNICLMIPLFPEKYCHDKSQFHRVRSCREALPASPETGLHMPSSQFL